MILHIAAMSHAYGHEHHYKHIVMSSTALPCNIECHQTSMPVDIFFETSVLFYCPASIAQLVAQLTVMLDKSMPVFFSRPLLSKTFFTNSEPNACGVFLRECFSRRKSIAST